MMTSNLSVAAGSAPGASGPGAIRKRKERAAATDARKERLRSFIPDLYYLKRLFTRRKFEANQLAACAVEKRPGNRRHPAHPVAVRVRLIRAHDAIGRFGSVAFPHRDGRAKSDHVRRPFWGWDDFRGLQTFLELHDALVEPGQ